ncbi:MAG: CinA family protein [Clostridia bacterium]|nr:CinA family protein [Clostridia bacterium]
MKNILYSGGKPYIDDARCSRVEELLELVRKRGWRVATAESCTGGLIAKRLTDVPGCSDVFLGGVVSYANEVKESLLAVSREILETCGAVSPQVAEEMAQGVCRALGVNVGIATTGIAGPGGGSAAKPVGLVYIGICINGQVEVVKLNVNRNFSREQIRNAAAGFAIEEARAILCEKINNGY